MLQNRYFCVSDRTKNWNGRQAIMPLSKLAFVERHDSSCYTHTTHNCFTALLELSKCCLMSISHL